jgi:DNA-binding NarL/FixJ family response regulator
MAQDGNELVRLAKELQPDFVLVDISMPLLNGVEATRRIRQVAPEAKVIVLTQHNDRQYMRAAFAAGACGYVLKQSAASELIEAMQEVQDGRYYVSKALLQPGEAARFDAHVNPGELFGGSLTPRQREVVQLVAEGHSAKQIAYLLNISTKTVEFHKAGIMQQLGLTSTAELIRYAVETGMVRS